MSFSTKETRERLNAVKRGSSFNPPAQSPPLILHTYPVPRTSVSWSPSLHSSTYSTSAGRTHRLMCEYRAVSLTNSVVDYHNKRQSYSARQTNIRTSRASSQPTASERPYTKQTYQPMISCRVSRLCHLGP